MSWKLAAIGVEPLGNTPAESSQKIVADNRQWATAVKDSGAVLQ
ncbi:hypothetical protein GCM10007242_09280 [Pigmentiphaga litoralis]|nr:hypothetical protein [Pigmentiphaga litoralis]GGX06116.1 hypothetical protein GCM10007242_09280 [Pigmentiphaga litoralis]